MAAACVPEHSPTVPSHVSTGFPNLTGSQGAVAWSKYLQEPQNFTRLHELLQLDAPESCAREALESAVWSSVESAQSAPAQIQLTVTESTIAARLHADWGRAPSDRPDAILVADLPDAKCWRRAGVDGATDEYETEVWLPVKPETFLKMVCDVQERVLWDDTTLSMQVLSTRGVARLARLHEQAGDEMMLNWLLKSPWPLYNRE